MSSDLRIRPLFRIRDYWSPSHGIWWTVTTYGEHLGYKGWGGDRIWYLNANGMWSAGFHLFSNKGEAEEALSLANLTGWAIDHGIEG